MRNLWTIIKKELRRFFTDRRMLISLLLPGIMIFILYSIMGDVMTNNLGQGEDQVYTLKVENEPDGFKDVLSSEFNLEYQDELEAVDALALIEERTRFIYCFSLNFLDEYQAGHNPSVEIHYNAASPTSSTMMNIYSSFLSNSLQQFTFDVENHASEVDTSLMLITGLIPFLLITFLFSGAMAVAPESIAGEKERGTIANLLITPVKRSHIALGKIIALSLIALTSAASSFVGLMLRFTKTSRR